MTRQDIHDEMEQALKSQTERVNKTLDRIYSLSLFGYTNTDVLTQEQLKDLFKKIMLESQ